MGQGSRDLYAQSNDSIAPSQSDGSGIAEMIRFPSAESTELGTESRRMARMINSEPSTSADYSDHSQSVLSFRNPNVALTPKSCCCGLVKYAIPSGVVQDLQKLEKTLRGDEEKGRWPFIDYVGVQMFFGGLIMLNSMCIGLDIMVQNEDGSSATPMIILESLFLIAFWVELVLRFGSHGSRRFCKDPWGPFDFGVTLLGSIDAWVLTPFVGSNAAMSGVSALRTLRLLRLFRLIRVFRAFTELSRLVKVLIGAFQSLTWVTVLLVLIVYVSCILVLILLKPHENDSEDLKRLTAGLGWTMFYHCFIVTLEGHIDILVWPTAEVSILWYVYWVGLIVFINFLMINMMVGLIVTRTLCSSQEEDARVVNFVYEAQTFKSTLLQLFKDKDIEEEGHISTDELVKLMGSEKMTQIMSAFGINTDLPREFLLTLMAFQDEKYISFTRFYESCVRICGASRDIRAFMLQYDISRFQREVSQRIKHLGKKLGHKKKSRRPSQERILSMMDGGPGSPSHQGTQPFSGLSFSSPPPPKLPLSPQYSGAGGFGISTLSPRRDAGKSLSPSRSGIASVGKTRIKCRSSLGGGFNDGFNMLVFKATKKLSAMERRQEEMILSLSELRIALFGVSHWTVIRCKNGHPLVPLGTSKEPVGSADYKHWSCDAINEPSGCRHGTPPGSHLTRLRRYHCKLCRYDMCEDCYNSEQHKRGVGKLSTTPPLGVGGGPSPPVVEEDTMSKGYSVDSADDFIGGN